MKLSRLVETTAERKHENTRALILIFYTAYLSTGPYVLQPSSIARLLVKGLVLTTTPSAQVTLKLASGETAIVVQPLYNSSPAWQQVGCQEKLEQRLRLAIQHSTGQFATNRPSMGAEPKREMLGKSIDVIASL